MGIAGGGKLAGLGAATGGGAAIGAALGGAAAGLGGGVGRSDASPSGRTEKTALQMLHRARTPPSGTFAGSTR